jgi:tRNA dimethylallyltransferase
MSPKLQAVLIAGPTASGKSALAISLARRTGGVVVNADSMQVYRDLHVITARPSSEDEAEAPHRLYGHVDGATNYSLGHYMADAAAILDEARAQDRLPIFVGGTGLYFKALLDGISDIPAVPAEVRERVRSAGEGRPTPDLHLELQRLDPETAHALRPTDRLRVLRALEVFEATGCALASFHGRRGGALLSSDACARFFLAPDRDWLRERINARFAAMMVAGALEEVRRLAGRGLDPALPVMRAHGVPGVLAHLRGEIGLEEAVVRGQADTRRYAKRQFTWFRHQMPGWAWVAPEEAASAMQAAIG